FAIKLVQAAAIGYPESSRSVFAHKVYSVPSDACGVRRIMGVTSGLPRGGIQLVKSSGCCQPQDSGGVFRDSLYRSGETARALCVDVIVSKGFAGRLKFVESSTAADPQRSRTIYKQAANIHTAQAVGASGFVPEYFRFVAVI